MRGVRVGVGLQIGAHPHLPGVLADIGFQHAQHRRTLAVGDGVTQGVHLGRGLGRPDHRMGGRGGVQRQGPFAPPAGHAVAPVRMQVVDGLGGHPGGEALVEPEVVPPVHGDQVAEPLVRHLVGDGAGDVLAVLLRRQLRVDQQVVLEIEDGAPVLHGPEAARARRRDEIELGQRVANAEVGVVVAQEGARLVERETGLHRLAAGDHHPDVHAVDLAADPLEIADAQEHQIGRHLRRGLEQGPLQAAWERLDPGDGRVGDGHLAGGRDHAELEARLHAGVVPQGRKSARIGVLELADHHPLGALRRGVVEVEQPRGEVVDPASIVDGQDVMAGGERAAEVEADGLAGGVQRDLRRRPSVEAGAGDGQIERVQDHGGDGLAHVDLDGLRSRERQLLGVGRDVDAVADRPHRGCKPERGAGLTGGARGRGRLGRGGIGGGPRAGAEAKGEAAEGKDKEAHSES